MDATCPYCGDTFGNPYCLGPHKKTCKQRFNLVVDDPNFSDSSLSSNSNGSVSECSNSHPRSVQQIYRGLWYLAQRKQEWGVESTPPPPPPGMYQCVSALSADYTHMQDAWSAYTHDVAGLCHPSFWETFDILRLHPGFYPHMHFKIHILL